jgi:hypothetical protein
MGLEGAVRLGCRRELEAAATPAARQPLFDQLVARLYAEGRAINIAACLEIDAVIDPRETRGGCSGVLPPHPPAGPVRHGVVSHLVGRSRKLVRHGIRLMLKRFQLWMIRVAQHDTTPNHYCPQRPAAAPKPRQIAADLTGSTAVSLIDSCGI